MTQYRNPLYYLLITLLLTTYSSASPTPTAQSPPLAKPTEAPPGILRLNTDMHTAWINSITIDAKGQYLVTGSDDKTARVWSLPDGKLLRVLRPPIGERDEGRVDAVALSPDGKTVAVGGWTGYEWDKAFSIYLFDRLTGELQQRLTGLPNVTKHLAYSTDSRYLVASLDGAQGIRIYQTPNYELVAKDTDYHSENYWIESNWAEFDSQGQLVTSGDSGSVRLYDKHFNLLKKRLPAGITATRIFNSLIRWYQAIFMTPYNQRQVLIDDKIPYAVRFSPTGAEIAVGFIDATQVSVLSGHDLKLLYSLVPQGMENGNLSQVAWSTDGKWLYAGGSYFNATGLNQILRWSNVDKEVLSQWPVACHTITDLRTLPDGKIVFSAQDPAFGILSTQGETVVYRVAEIADFRGIFKGSFRLSKDGDRVQFGYVQGGKQTAQFSIRERTFITPFSPEDLLPPRISTPEFTVRNWEDTMAPKFNGKSFYLENDGRSQSLAITPDGQQFLLGACWSLYLFDKQGQQQWEVPVPAPAWGVNIAGNGKVAVAALGDGTIRWYRLQDGKELVALFPHKDRTRWIVWTPEGYYDASPGAENLVGWHINQGHDKEAKFIPLGEQQEKYHRPDLIMKVLEEVP